MALRIGHQISARRQGQGNSAGRGYFYSVEEAQAASFYEFLLDRMVLQLQGHEREVFRALRYPATPSTSRSLRGG